MYISCLDQLDQNKSIMVAKKHGHILLDIVKLCLCSLRTPPCPLETGKSDSREWNMNEWLFYCFEKNVLICYGRTWWMKFVYIGGTSQCKNLTSLLFGGLKPKSDKVRKILILCYIFYITKWIIWFYVIRKNAFQFLLLCFSF